jgi:hypothetical protein
MVTVNSEQKYEARFWISFFLGAVLLPRASLAVYAVRKHLKAKMQQSLFVPNCCSDSSMSAFSWYPPTKIIFSRS